jgi:hypothetical protein
LCCQALTFLALSILVSVLVNFSVHVVIKAYREAGVFPQPSAIYAGSAKDGGKQRSGIYTLFRFSMVLNLLHAYYMLLWPLVEYFFSPQ